MNHKLFKLMEEVVLVNKQIIIRFTTVVHNLATFPGQITSWNTQIEWFTGESDQKFSNQYSIRGY